MATPQASRLPICTLRVILFKTYLTCAGVYDRHPLASEVGVTSVIATESTSDHTSDVIAQLQILSFEDAADHDAYRLVAQLTVMLDKSMPVVSSMPFLFQTFSHTLNQMHVVVFSESILHVGNLLYQPDTLSTAFLYVVLCLLAPCWPPGH